MKKLITILFIFFSLFAIAQKTDKTLKNKSKNWSRDFMEPSGYMFMN